MALTIRLAAVALPPPAAPGSPGSVPWTDDRQVRVAGDLHPVLAAGRARLRPVGRAVVVDAGDVLDDEERATVDDRRAPRSGTRPGSPASNVPMPATSIGALERAGARRRSSIVVELHAEQVGEDPHHRRPHHVEREVEEHQRQLVHRAAEADHLADDLGLVVERVVEELLDPDLGDARR